MKKIFQIILTLMLCLALAAPALAEIVNINKADQQALQYYLKGVGKVKAKAIVDYRRKHGNFKSVNELLEVPGIGKATLKKIRKNISLTTGVTKAPKNIATKKSSSKKSTSVKSSKSRKGSKSLKKNSKKSSSKSKKSSKSSKGKKSKRRSSK